MKIKKHYCIPGKSIAFIVFTFVSLLSGAQVLTVIDTESNIPLDRATISSEKLNVYAVTNVKGQADISLFKGASDIEVRLLGYATKYTSYLSLEQSGFRMALLPSDISLDQVVVSTSRSGFSKKELPFRVVSVTPKDIAIQNPQTAADLLSSSGDVFIQKSQQGGGSPMIRGFSTNRLLYTVDGVRMNTAIFRSGNLQNVISLDPFAMENAEVLFGAGSVIYGSDAIGGVMSFKTITPQFSLSDEELISGKAIARYASANDERTAHFNVNVGLKKWAFVTSFSTNDFGDLKMGNHGPEDYLRPFYVERQNDEDVVVANEDDKVQVPSGYTQINLMQKIRFQPSKEWDFQYGFHYSETSEYSRYDRHIRLRNGEPRSGEWNYGPQIWMMNSLLVSHAGSTAMYDKMNLRLAHQYFEESRIDRDFNDAERRTRLEKVNAFSVNFDLTKKITKNDQLFYGMELVLDDVSSEGTDKDILTGSSRRGASRYPDADWWSYAAYLVYEHAFSDKVTMEGGLRYNRFVLDADFSNNTDFYPIPESGAKIDDGALTGSLGVVYTPADSWALTANLATAFRAPNVDDVGKVFDSEPGSVVVPNTDLGAEYAYNAEIGISKIIDSKLRLDVNAYYTHLDNAMVRRDYIINGRDSIMYDGELSKVQAIQNAAKAKVYGLQLGVEAKLVKGVSLLSKLNIQNGEEELDSGETSPSRHVSPLFGLSRISYHADKLNMQLYAVYNGRKSYNDLAESEKEKDYLYAKDGNGNPYSPAWCTLNFKASQQLTEFLAVTAGLENITDRRYRPYSSGLAAAGRNFILALRATF